MPDPIIGDWQIVVTDSNVTAIHAHLMPNGKVLYFHARYVSHDDNFVSCLFDPSNNSIYSPGYLFDGNRPVITSAPSTINYGTDFQVSYTGADILTTIDSVVLISLPSVTHCFDANQKYVILDFEQIGAAGNLNVHPPANAYIAQPGPYMLFLLRKKSESTSRTNRIPSVAVIVSLQ